MNSRFFLSSILYKQINITMKQKIYLQTLLLFCLLLISESTQSKSKQVPQPLKVGYSVGINGITAEKMKYAKAVGITCIETSLNAIVEKGKYSEEEIIRRVKAAKAIADEAGIQIWSIHMPFGNDGDLSQADENERKSVVDYHKSVLKYCRILKPKIILFHPSFYLGLNERGVRMNQMIQSAIELNKEVKKIGAKMVIENMLGYELLRDKNRERPLCRTVDEMMTIMNRLPKNIYAAVDMNHIKNPEKLIRALGKRLKSVHVSDGDGKKECHYFPCSGKGENNWIDILSALNEVNYKGPFMYESQYPDVKDLVSCYQTLYEQYISTIKR